VCLFAYSSRTDTPICTKLGMLISWDQEEIIGGSKLRKSVLSSIPAEGVSCSSETKQDRRMAPIPKLFVSNRRLQKQRPESRQIVLGSIPSEDNFCSSDTKHDRRTAPRPKLFVSKRRLYKQTPQHLKLSWLRVLTRKFYVAPKLSTWEEWRKGKICSFRRGNYRN
jgi:hypothetical protein